MQPLQLEEHEPSAWQTWPPQEEVPVQAMHCHCPLLQMGVGIAQSELSAQPTHAP